MDLFKPPGRLALSLWTRALQTGHSQRVSALASRLHFPSSTVGPQPVSGCIERWYSVSRHCRRSFGGPAPFLQGTLEALLPSGATFAATLPNHSLNDIKCSGSLTCPSPIRPKQRRTLERRSSPSLPSNLRSQDFSRTFQFNPNRTCIYLLVFIINQLLSEGLEPSLSSTSAIPADPRFYQGEVWTGLRE
ncbi:hypothetical protein BKA70DRAFT_297795 [Coprinopsis sp. MPI-PUGE-AT-0042]|nr:hypothetical protein BKA70DRAFT_297795 [Coprinopsis sp. MPI-PUGE-AT-0042]